MIKRLSMLIVIGFGAVFATCAGLYCMGRTAERNDPSSASAQEPVASAKPAQTEQVRVVDVSATDLFAAYDANEVSADNMYKGQMLRVSGVVKSIDKDFMNHVVIRFVAGKLFDVVDAQLSPEEEVNAAGYSKGQRLTFICQGRGRHVRRPLLKGCFVDH